MVDEVKRFLRVNSAGRYSIVERVAALPERERRRLFRGKSEAWLKLFLTAWCLWGRPGQLPPEGGWRIWFMMAGRGYGKTRAGAEWVHHLAEETGLRIALVGPTEDEVRRVMIEGASGLLACAPPGGRPDWEPSLGRLTWPSGSVGFVYSGVNAESLRGPEHDFAWCDELGKWPQPEAAWDNLMFGLRRGRYPRAMITTTPRPTPLLRRLIGRGDVARSRGRTADNVMLAGSFVDYVTGLYGGTRLGRQELDGELIEEVEGSLWPRGLIERARAAIPLPGREGIESAAMSPGHGCERPGEVRTASMAGPAEGGRNTDSEKGSLSLAYPSPAPPFQGGGFWRRIVIGVDPPASAAGTCGIVACGLGADGIGYVLGDHSAAGLSPEGWARRVVAAARAWGAERVVAEANQGGEMVASVLRSVDPALPVKCVHARYGKSSRAEPVAMQFEIGRAKFAGVFPELEDELTGMTIGGGYEGPGRSPDRADAMVWALTELLCGKPRAEPRIRVI